MKSFVSIFLITILLSANAIAGSDGENEISKKNKVVKDCFEPLNRATFALNMGIDKVCLLYTSPSPRDGLLSRMPSSA